MSNFSSQDPVQTVLAKLDGVKQTGPAQWEARCPAHEDRHASLSVGRGDDGRALAHCHAGCALGDVLAKIGLKDTDLFVASDAPRPSESPAPKAKKARTTCPTGRRVYKTPEEVFAAVGRQVNGQCVAAWQYPGDTLRVGRFDLPGTDPETGKRQKTFRPIHSVKGGWSIGDPSGLLPPYRGDQLPDDGPVFVLEGEGKTDAAASVGLSAVTSAHGAGSAHKSDWRALAGREIVILPDYDDAGRQYALEVATILNKLTPPATVKIIDLPGLGEHGDFVDWAAADGPMSCKTGQEIKAAVLDMARDAAPWTPPVVSTSTPAANPVEPYRPFPVDCLPEPMRSFVAQAAEAFGCDAAFVALPLLAAAASAIGNTRRIELKRGWTEPAILWAVIVGESGTLKSPAQELALRSLRERQHKAMKQHAQGMEAHGVDVMRYEIDLTVWKKSGGEGPPPAEPQPPVLSRCWCDDTTIESLAVLLLQNWRGLLMARDELTGWLGGFDRYTQSKGGDVAKWLEMHGGRSIIVDRKTGNARTIYVPYAAVSMTGAISPATLQRALGRAYFENGLAARLLLACPPRRVKRWTETEIDPVTETAVATVLDRLYSLEPVLGQDGEPEPHIVRLSPEAKRRWVVFYNEHAQEHVDLTGDLSAAWSKLEGYAARLALVVRLVRWAAGDPILAGPDVVDETSITAGVVLSRWFGQETRRVYAILAETEADRQRRRLVELVQRHGGAVTARDLMRSARAYPTSEIAEQALNGLVEAGDGRWQDEGPTEQGGRPTRRFVLADTVDVDTTPKPPEKPGVSSTEPGKAALGPVAAPAMRVPLSVDKTPELPKESKVPSTSTPSTPARATALDPDTPGPSDLLDAEQRKRYLAIYHSRPASMPPAEKHARAWRAALGGRRP